jgi:hypothetical protein
MMQTAHNILRHDFDMLANCEWEQFHANFEKHTGHIDDLNEWTQPAMLTLHSLLLLRSEYQYALERAMNEKITNHNLVIPLFNNGLLRANLVSITPEQSLPLHDHPGSSGAVLVISGEIRATACERVATPNNNQLRVMLTTVEKKIFTKNKTSCFTKEQQNIHSFEALTERAVLMVIHTPPFEAIQQSYFFMANPQQKIGSQMLAQRVRAHALQKFNNSKMSALKATVK